MSTSLFVNPHCQPPSVLTKLFIILSKCVRNNAGDIKKPCLTPISTHSDNFSPWIIDTCIGTSFMRLMIFLDTPNSSPLYTDSLVMESNAFWKSTEDRYTGDWKSAHCSAMIFRILSMSILEWSFLKPACSFLRFVSIMHLVLYSYCDENFNSHSEQSNTSSSLGKCNLSLEFRSATWTPRRNDLRYN